MRFQQYTAPGYIAKSTKEWFEEQGIGLFEENYRVGLMLCMSVIEKSMTDWV